MEHTKDNTSFEAWMIKLTKEAIANFGFPAMSVLDPEQYKEEYEKGNTPKQALSQFWNAEKNETKAQTQTDQARCSGL